jgi:hypothetical protein
LFVGFVWGDSVSDDGLESAEGHALAIKDFAGLIGHTGESFITHDFGIGGIAGGTVGEDGPGERYSSRRSFGMGRRNPSM